MLLDIAADLFRKVGLRIAAEQTRPAAQTGAKAGLLGLVGTREELHVLAPRTSGRTRGPAIHAGGGYREDELAVVGRITRKHQIPAPVFIFQSFISPRFVSLIVILPIVLSARAISMMPTTRVLARMHVRGLRVRMRDRHLVSEILCEYGIHGHHWESRVGGIHDRERLRRGGRTDYPNLAGKVN